nr:MAG TPA: Major head protein [Caudoviricetes sp.]
MSDVEKQESGGGAAGKAPWSDEDFDSGRARRLVENLRGELAEVKAKLAAAVEKSEGLEKAQTRIAELEKDAAEKGAALTKSKKEGLLSARGLPANLISTLVGDTEEEWTEVADMLAALKGPEEKPVVQADPIQSASAQNMSQDEQDLALARQIFG